MQDSQTPHRTPSTSHILVLPVLALSRVLPTASCTALKLSQDPQGFKVLKSASLCIEVKSSSRRTHHLYQCQISSCRLKSRYVKTRN
ncbi:hypothetical protein C8F04DRAFT_1151608 [Mycena alexandri]|uniref:Secreted protein n=1 Tax=Mycena alexandri TaxID=1745969 RepID=A0AAD6S079_9AGAR|nr:hypothetical protein C8F04DRAFT_1151608 [Mycena alexandri]